MPSFLLLWAAKIAIPEPFRKAAVIAVGVVLLLIAIFAAVKIHDHRVIVNHDLKQQVKVEQHERQADANLQVQKSRDQAASDQRQQEIDNATKSIPDQAPSARQRARACLELQRQAKQRRKPAPSC